jgi:Protein of unknown function (DUF2892)
MFKLNEASWDRILRVVLGIALLYVGLAGVVTGTLGIVLAVSGDIFLLTGIVGFCPLYTIFGIRTRRA